VAAAAQRPAHPRSSDHAPSTSAHKSAGNIWEVHFGLPELDSTMAVLRDAPARRRLAYEDIVLVDPAATRKADVLSKAGWPRSMGGP
jgi:dihydroorotase-like cyclic amidohydrolase